MRTKTDPFSKIENATITLPNKGGQGILVKNQMILTAAHCVDYVLTGGMVLGDYYIEEIKTRSGNLKVAPFCIEPLSDIAVLGALDEQECNSEFQQFDDFCRNTKPIKICRTKLEVYNKFKIFSHKKKWITGYAQIVIPESHMLSVEVDEKIEGGLSGSAIVNEKGEIVGIVSNFSENVIPYGCAPRPHLTLPVWICHQI
jgi:hypothetical protein